MRKLSLVAFAALSYVVVMAGTALAQSGSDLTPPGGDQVKGTVVTPPEPTAFTGADLGIWLIAIAALAVIGTVLFIAGRRRAVSVG